MDDEFMEIDFGDEEFEFDCESEVVDETSNIQNLFYDAENALDKYLQCLELSNQSNLGELSFNCILAIILLKLDLPYKNEEIKKYIDDLFENSRSNTVIAVIESLKKVMDKVSITKAYENREILLKYLASKLENIDKYNKLYLQINMKLCHIAIENDRKDEVDAYLEEIEKSEVSASSLVNEINALKLSISMLRGEKEYIVSILSNFDEVQVIDPRVLCVIFEARGVISSDKRDWQSAYTNFSQSFKHYYDCGSLNKAKDLLILAIVYSILNDSKFDPSDTNEGTRFHTNECVIEARKLREYYLQSDIYKFRTLINGEGFKLNQYKLISNKKEILLENVKEKYVERLCDVYSTIRFDFISENIGMPSNKIVPFLINFIRDKGLNAKIDLIDSVLIVINEETKEERQQNIYFENLLRLAESTYEIIDQL